MSNKYINEEMTDEEQDSLESVAKKKEKKKKTKEEKHKDRKVVFWMLVLVIIITAGFWIKAVLEGKEIKTQIIENSKTQDNEKIQEKNEGGFFLKYKI